MVFTSCEKLDPNSPQACFVTPDEIVAGLPTLFNSSCSVNATSFSWDFGDGSVSSESNPSHTYEEAGTFTVTLTAGNGSGDTDQASKSITVTAPSVIEHSGTISADETWIEGVHLVKGDVYVDAAILTIAPGATVLIGAGYGIYVGYHSGFSGAALVANGTAGKPILFTSAAATMSPGDWDYIGFYSGSSTLSSMQYCTVEYGGGYSSNVGAIHVSSSTVAIQNSTIRHSQSYGISLDSDGFFGSFTGNTVDVNGSSAISIYGNHVHTIGAGNSISSPGGILIDGDHIEHPDVTWQEQTCAYVLDGDLYVGSETGSVLTLMPGVEIRMGSSSGIYVGYNTGTFGTLNAQGTSDKHIRFTSSAAEAFRAPGNWDYIGFYQGAGNNSSLAYCDIEYGGGYSGNVGMIHVTGSAISMTNCTLSKSESMGVSMTNSGMFTACTGNTFEDNAVVPIEIYGNYAHTIGTGNTYNTGPGILVNGERMEQESVTWLNQGIPYIIDGDLYVGTETGAQLTIEPGTTVKFTSNSSLYVGYHTGTFGILTADGEPGNEITFTTGAASGFEAAGDWEGIWFYDGTSSGTILDHCVISYGGGYSSNSGNLNVRNGIAAGLPVISNCRIENSAAYGIHLGTSVSPELSGNTFVNNALGDTN